MILHRLSLGLIAAAAVSACAADAPTSHADGPLGSGALPLDASRSVLTQHNDNGRSGTATHETALTPASVRSGFGRIGRWKVDGQVAAQPLYVHGLFTNGVARNMVVVATRTNTVDVFDADATAPTGHLIYDPIHLTLSGNSAVEMPGMDHRVPNDTRPLCKQTHGPVGIAATPVIDATGKMYVVARVAPPATVDGAGYLRTTFDAQYAIFTIDLTTGLPHFERTIASPPYFTGSNAFDPNRVLNRPALLLDHGRLYVAFGGAVCDAGGGDPNDPRMTHGWVFAYDATSFAQLAALNTSFNPDGARDREMAGIWQSGQGLVADANGAVYAMTGNNTPGRTNADETLARGNELLKMEMAPGTSSNGAWGFKVSEYRVQRWAGLDAGDTDLGAGGPALLPGGQIVGGGKEGRLYIVDTQTIPNTHTMKPLAVDSSLTLGATDGALTYRNTWHPEIAPENYYQEQEYGPNIHGAPLVWTDAEGQTYLYAMPEKEFLTRYTLNANGTINPVSHVHATWRSPDGMPGSALSISSNGGSSGIVWAVTPARDELNDFGPGRLLAFDAETLELLYSDEADSIAFSKYTPPTVADGKVFRATFGGELVVYGALGSAAPASICRTTYDEYRAQAGADGLGAWPAGTDPNAARVNLTLHDYWYDGASYDDHLRNTAILSSPSTCAHLLRGNILTAYDRATANGVSLGFPITDDLSTTADRLRIEVGPQPEQGAFTQRYTHTEHGSIFASSRTDAHYTYGPIRDLWASLDWDRGLGFPMIDPAVAPPGHGQWQKFGKFAFGWDPIVESAITYSATTGAHSILGGIYAFWLAHPSLGLAIDEEHDGAAPDGRAARVSDFENGSVYWIKASAAAGTPETFGVWHANAAAEWFDLSNDDVRRTNWDFSDVESVGWAQAARAATGYCARSGFVGGHFTGEQTRSGASMRGVVCYARGARYFDASYTNALQHQTWQLSSSSLDANTWAVAGRSSDEFCRNQGYLGGFFTGNQGGDLRGVVCANPPADAFDAHQAEIDATGWSFADVNTVSWSQAARAAHHVCIAHGGVGGRFAGHQVPDLRKLVCVR